MQLKVHPRGNGFWVTRIPWKSVRIGWLASASLDNDFTLWSKMWNWTTYIHASIFHILELNTNAYYDNYSKVLINNLLQVPITFSEVEIPQNQMLKRSANKKEPIANSFEWNFKEVMPPNVRKQLESCLCWSLSVSQRDYSYS